jgi:4-alpha-glucanotransferase
MEFRHHSWEQAFRSPFGALPTGSDVTLRVYATQIEKLVLHASFNDQEVIHPMIKSWESNYWEITLTMPMVPGLFWYDFSFSSQGRSYAYGTMSDHLGGEGRVYESKPQSYQITVYDPKRQSPAWYSQGIMYQIFPDRFKRGADFDLANFHKDAILHPNWNDNPHYFREKDGGIKYWDFFGGTLSGITEKLDYLQSLNVTILYLNPIFKSQSNHRYDTGDYMCIDPALGTQKSFETLASECKKRAISIILDGVFSHTGDDSLYFNRYGHYPVLGAYQSKDSDYYPWYTFTDYPKAYTCWWGVDAMPNTNEMHPNFQAFIYKNKDSVIRHWMKAGASGWRLDVADELPDPFIKGLKEAMVEENPDSILIGEVWEDASRKVAYDELRSYFSGYELDAVMNYPFRETFIDFVIGDKSSGSAARIMMSLYEHYPKDQFMGNMNLIGSHDRRRILNVLGEAYKYLGNHSHKTYRLDDTQYALAVKRLKLLSLIQFTFPGVPCLYYGDEVGVQGFEDPYNRRTYPWGNEDQDLLAWYQLITKLRADHPVFQNGTWKPYEASDDLFVFERRNDNALCFCLFNRNSRAVHLFKNPDFTGCQGFDLITKQAISLNPIVLQPLSYAIVMVTPDTCQII